MNDHGVSVIFRDLLLGVIGILVLAFFIVLLQVSPKAKDQTAKADPPGNLIAAITWPAGNNDVDIWIDGPGEPVAIGYSNKSGVLWNLLRDDLGDFPDATPFNYENAYTRGVVPGDYTINVHCYRCPILPIMVDVEISVNAPMQGKTSTIQIASSHVELRRAGQERTALRFTLDANGNADPASFSTVYKPLRAMKVTPE